MTQPLEATDVRRTPCHCASVTGNPAVVWCIEPGCSRTFHADAPELFLADLANQLVGRDLFSPEAHPTPLSLPRPRLHLVHDAARGDRRIP